MKTKTMTYAEKLREEGLLRGRQEGRQEGHLEGQQEGIQQGSLQSRYEFARKLILRNMPLSEICELTDLTMEEVKKLDLRPRT